MPHIDDGTLHAWLDGALDAVAADGALPDGMQAADVVAHVERCADCRARLEREREIRERAGLVLRAAAPSQIHTPPLTQQRPRRRTWLPLAWAASLLMAVGAGWWGSQIARDTPVGDAAAYEELQATEQPARSAPPTSPSAFSGPAAVPHSPAPAPATNEAAGYAAAAPAADRSATAPDAVDAAMRDVNAADAAGSRAAGDITAAAVAAEPRLETVQSPLGRAAAAPAARAPARTEADAAVARAPARTEAHAPVAQAPPPPAPAPLPSVMALQERPATGVTTGDHSLAAGFLARDSAGLYPWTPIRSGSVTGIVDAEVIAAQGTSEIGARITRVTQRLGTGDTIEVLSWSAEAIQLSQVVVTGEPAVRPQRSRAQAERAEVTQKPENAAASLHIVRPGSMDGALRQPLLFATQEGWILVRAPAWLRAADIQARLGAVSVAPAAR